METYDVAIIGAGPAGSTLAYHIAKSGIRTCIIDKQRFPRKKTCAGGLPPKVIELLPFDNTPIIRNEISSIRLTHRIAEGFSRTHAMPLLYTVTREEFDHFLLGKAVATNATLIEGEAVHTISQTSEGFYIKTPNREIKAPIIAGADGANSLTAKRLGLNPIDSTHLAIQIEVPTEKMPNDDFGDTAIALDWGFMKDSYAWMFPNGNHYSIGAMARPKSAQALKSYLAQWTKHHGLDLQDFQLHAQSIPHRISRRPITAGCALLIGDAAGLADYWTGEGIYYAIKSATIAATCITQYIAGNPTAIAQYETAINETMLPELTASYQFSKMFNHGHLAAFHAMRKYPYMWDLFCRLIRGDRSFSEIKKRLRPITLARKLLSKNKRTTTSTT